jgi:aspartyl-tRNA(Asn)/glutamyl-tRNA(Gln) amidotransferase subunit A
MSRWGLVAFASSLDVIGSLTRDVATAVRLLESLLGRDPRDASSRGEPLDARRARESVRGLRVAVPWGEVLASDVSADVVAAFRAALAALAAHGVEIVPVEIPSWSLALPAYVIVAAAEAASNLARYDGSFYGRRGASESYDRLAAATRGIGLGREVQRRLLLGTFVLSAGYRERFYRRATCARARLAYELAAICEDAAAIAVPTASSSAFRFGERSGDPLAMYHSDALTVPANLAGLPAVSLPAGCGGDGLPLGVQLIGPRDGEERLLALAAAIERELAFAAREDVPWRR